jgi:hypothetical protein
MKFPNPRLTYALRDEKAPTWDMSQERAFMETLLNQRLNFFLVFFAAVVAGTLSATELIQVRVLLTIGLLIGLLMFLSILRADIKLSLIIRYLRRDRTHPVRIIDRMAGPPSLRRWLTVGVPVICTALLVAGCASAWLLPFPFKRSTGDDLQVLRQQVETLQKATKTLDGRISELVVETSRVSARVQKLESSQAKPPASGRGR